MAPIRAGVVIPFARRLFDESGAIKDESYNARANSLLDQLLWWARALKAAREDIPKSLFGKEQGWLRRT
jgi:hypothetical protein